jgi:hypothetical protein
MTTVSLQSTAIFDDRVEILIADAPERDAATFWLDFCAPVSVDRAKTLAATQLEALHYLRNELSGQIQAITHNPGLKP